MDQIKVNLKITINILYELINNNKNDFIDFQKKYDSIYTKSEDKRNEIIKKVSKYYEINIQKKMLLNS